MQKDILKNDERRLSSIETHLLLIDTHESVGDSTFLGPLCKISISGHVSWTSMNASMLTSKMLSSVGQLVASIMWYR